MSRNFLSYSYIYDNGIFRPLIEVSISHGGLIAGPIEALADSGSDKNLFPARIAERLGIDLNKYPVKTILGIGEIRIKAQPVKITLHLYRFSFQTEIDFSHEQKLPVLGRNGFFDRFKSIKFKEGERFLDIELKDGS